MHKLPRMLDLGCVIFFFKKKSEGDLQSQKSKVLESSQIERTAVIVQWHVYFILKYVLMLEWCFFASLILKFL